MKGFAWRRGGGRLGREESQLLPRWKAKSPGGAAPWCVGHIKIFDRLQHYEKPFFFLLIGGKEVLFFHPPPTCHTPIRPPDWPVSLFRPSEFKASPLGAAQCALTPCNEISSCCETGFNQRVRAKTYCPLFMNHLFHRLMADSLGHCCCCRRPITQPGSPTENKDAFSKGDLAESAATATQKLPSQVLQSKGSVHPSYERKAFSHLPLLMCGHTE